MYIAFKLLEELDFPLLLKWLEAIHVKQWWDKNTTYTFELVQKKYGTYCKGYKLVGDVEKTIAAFIIYNNQNPVGYVQIYNIYDFSHSKLLCGLPEKLGSIDIFIGEKNVLQQ